MKKLFIFFSLFIFHLSLVNAQVPVNTPPGKDTTHLATHPADTSVHAPVVVTPVLPMPDTSVHIYAPAAVQNTENKIYQYQHYNHGTSPGYRVQINFSQEKNVVDKMQADFAGKHPGVPAYVSYKQPYFRISVGDFRTRLQAVDFLEKIRKDYPGAFVVADKIEPPPLQ